MVGEAFVVATDQGHIDRAFDAAIDGPASERLIAQIMEKARRTPQAPPPLAARTRRWLRRVLEFSEDGWCRYALPATLALALGIVVGHATVDQSSYAPLQPSVENLIKSTRIVEPFKL